MRRTLDWTNVTGENEAFYLRVYTAGDYRYHGADMGILVARGRMQTDDRKLMTAPRRGPPASTASSSACRWRRKCRSIRRRRIR